LRCGCLTALLVTIALQGCNLTDKESTGAIAERPFLTPIQTTQDAVDLEVFFVERPIGDLLLGETLWKDLDQINTVAPDCRERLRQTGLRYGVSGSHPSTAVMALLKQRADDAPGRRTLRQQYRVPGGVTHAFRCGELEEDATIKLVNGGTVEERKFEQGHCVLRCRIERIQNGWARVDILPEIHHGESQMRRVARDDGWTMEAGQEVLPLYQQRFSVELNEGELLVLGDTGVDAKSLGSQFFHNETDDEQSEHILILRIGGLERVGAVVQPGF